MSAKGWSAPHHVSQSVTMKTLGIETSCDETGAAIFDSDLGILSNALYSQIMHHKNFGGVVPEIASRAQLEKISPIIKEALQQARLSLDAIDVIAVTNRPGLPGSLLVGLSFAKALSYAQNIPLIGINHLEGHAFSAHIESNIPFPQLTLTASGGHTALYLIEDFGQYTVLGQTLDDAAGEAFDKIAKLMNLPYPGGPIIEKLAAQGEFKDYFHYPRTKLKSLDFSFSGLKTAVMYDLIKRNAYDLHSKKFLAENNEDLKVRVASSLLVCIGDIFCAYLKHALEIKPHVQAITFVGGVACNKYLRTRLEVLADEHGLPFFTPSPQYCTDNGAMIAFVGNYKAKQGKFDDLTLDIGY